MEALNLKMLNPKDREREERIRELNAIAMEHPQKRPLHERRAAWNQMIQLIRERSPEVIERMEERMRA